MTRHYYLAGFIGLNLLTVYLTACGQLNSNTTPSNEGTPAISSKGWFGCCTISDKNIFFRREYEYTSARSSSRGTDINALRGTMDAQRKDMDSNFETECGSMKGSYDKDSSCFYRQPENLSFQVACKCTYPQKEETTGWNITNIKYYKLPTACTSELLEACKAEGGIFTLG